MALAVTHPGRLHVNVYVTLYCIAWGHRSFPYTTPIPVGEGGGGRGREGKGREEEGERGGIRCEKDERKEGEERRKV